MREPIQDIPIFFSADDGYAPFLSVALSSIIRNASKEYSYKAVVMYSQLSEMNKQKLASLSETHFKIGFISMENRLGGITDRMSNRFRDHFTLTIFFRLFIAAMFPEYDKAIYLDSDIVVPGDISELYRTELEENLLAAVADYSVLDVPPFVKYIEQGVGIDRHKYINSGVLLMNLKRMRELQLDRRFMELMNTYHFECVAPDQDYLNVMCKGKIVFLPSFWDVMPIEGKEPLKEPKLIHYNLFSKPWCYDSVQYEEYFWHYAEESAYLQEILDYKAQYGEKKRKSDRDCLTRMLTMAVTIAEAEENFRTIFEGGKERRL